MATQTQIVLITINPIDGILSVRAQITRTDDAPDELSKPVTHEENVDFKVADLADLNVTVGAATLPGAITALDPNG